MTTALRVNGNMPDTAIAAVFTMVCVVLAVTVTAKVNVMVCRVVNAPCQATSPPSQWVGGGTGGILPPPVARSMDSWSHPPR